MESATMLMREFHFTEGREISTSVISNYKGALHIYDDGADIIVIVGLFSIRKFSTLIVSAFQM